MCRSEIWTIQGRFLTLLHIFCRNYLSLLRNSVFNWFMRTYTLHVSQIQFTELFCNMFCSIHSIWSLKRINGVRFLLCALTAAPYFEKKWLNPKYIPIISTNILSNNFDNGVAKFKNGSIAVNSVKFESFQFYILLPLSSQAARGHEICRKYAIL